MANSEELKFPMLGIVRESLYELQTFGVPVAKIEVGPLTFEFLTELMIANRDFKRETPDVVRAKVAAGLTDITFAGSVVVRADVPEGRCWPSMWRG